MITPDTITRQDTPTTGRLSFRQLRQLLLATIPMEDRYLLKLVPHRAGTTAGRSSITTMNSRGIPDILRELDMIQGISMAEITSRFRLVKTAEHQLGRVQTDSSVLIRNASIIVPKLLKVSDPIAKTAHTAGLIAEPALVVNRLLMDPEKKFLQL